MHSYCIFKQSWSNLYRTHIESWFNLYWIYIQSIYNLYTIYIQSIYNLCTIYIQSIYNPDTIYIQSRCNLYTILLIRNFWIRHFLAKWLVFRLFNQSVRRFQYGIILDVQEPFLLSSGTKLGFQMERTNKSTNNELAKFGSLHWIPRKKLIWKSKIYSEDWTKSWKHKSGNSIWISFSSRIHFWYQQMILEVSCSNFVGELIRSKLQKKFKKKLPKSFFLDEK